ncbi:hypothetical protein [Candidatus Pyrohabitans sp.]
MGCKTVTYHGVTSSVFECLKEKLEKAGIHVPPGDSGEISGHGITADFSWNEGAATLSITIKKLPWYVSCGVATGKIHDEIHACGGD